MTIFFILDQNLRLKPFYLKLKSHFLKYVKKRGDVALETFLDFADVSSYLAFKISATERDCTVSNFGITMLQTSSTLLWKALAKFFQGK